MNIWIVNHYAVPPSIASGMVRHFYFAKYLQEKGHRVCIITSGRVHNTDINMIEDDSLYLSKEMDGVKYIFVHSHNYQGNGVDRIINMIGFPFEVQKTMQKLLKEDRPDVIYTSSPDIFVPFFTVKFCRKHKIPVVFEVRDLWPESIVAYSRFTKNNPIIKFLYRIEKWMYQKADRLIFTMEGGKDYIASHKWASSVDMEKIFHINNGIDLDEYESNLRKYRIDDKELEKTDCFKVVYMGSIRKVNHLESLIEAAEVLKAKDNSKIIFLIYGDGTERQMLEERSQKKSLNVFFKGPVERKYIPYILSKSDLNVINVLPSPLTKYGVSWNKLFEYMASGTPILANLSVNYDLIKKYHMGISDVFENAESYAKSIEKIASLSKENYSLLCENAKKASELFDYKKHADEVEKILLSLYEEKCQSI